MHCVVKLNAMGPLLKDLLAGIDFNIQHISHLGRIISFVCVIKNALCCRLHNNFRLIFLT